MTDIKVNKNNVVQLKSLLGGIKDKLNIEKQKTYAALYDRGRIEIIEFQDEVFKINASNYKTRFFHFVKIKEEQHEDLHQAWQEVFGEGVRLQIIGG